MDMTVCDVLRFKKWDFALRKQQSNSVLASVQLHTSGAFIVANFRGYRGPVVEYTDGWGYATSIVASETGSSLSHYRCHSRILLGYIKWLPPPPTPTLTASTPTTNRFQAAAQNGRSCR